jgi:YD repeat-containing protein
MGNPHPMQRMRGTNHPVQTITYVNNKVTSADITTYSKQGDFFKPTDSYHLETNIPLNDYSPLSKGNETTLYTLDPRMSKEATYSYYSNGNIKEIINTRTGIPTTILWSYDSQYPVAKIAGRTYMDIYGPMNTAVNNILNAAIPSDDDIKKIRNLYKSSYLITTCTYQPLVGIKTVTDPRGITTYYEYDGLGRLTEVRDMENNLLETYNYNYEPPAPKITSFVINGNLVGVSFTGCCPEVNAAMISCYNIATGAYKSSTSGCDDGHKSITVPQRNQNYVITIKLYYSGGKTKDTSIIIFVP